MKQHAGSPLFSYLLFGVLCAGCFGSGSVFGQNTTKLELLLDNLQQDTALRYASLGFCLIDVSSNKILAQRNANQALIPASTLKVISTGTAVAILGRNYKFKTELQYEGSIERGVLKGNLYIKGYGDPSLGSPQMSGAAGMQQVLDMWVAAVRKAGITRIEGAVIGDGTHFERQGVISTWQWGDVGNYYGAGAYGLNFHDNMYYVTLQQERRLESVPKIVRIEPALPELSVENYVRGAANGTGDNSCIFAAPFDNKVYMSGTIPIGSSTFRIKGSIPNPMLFAARMLQQALTAGGIDVRKPADWLPVANAGERQVLHTHYSPTLFDISKHTNEDSRNMYCEAMIKAIGLHAKGEATTENGLLALREFWAARGIDVQGMFLMDGSGLSARNGIPARILAQILRKMYLDNAAFGDFYEQLAIAGKTGTLAIVGKGTAAEGNLRAKSGSINRVRAYAGLTRTRSGRMVAFSIIANNYTCSGTVMRRKLEQILVGIAEMTD